MPVFESQRLGSLTYDSDSTIEFPHGLPGFDHRRAFLAVHLPGKDPLDRSCSNFFISAVLSKPAIKGRSYVFLFHVPPPFFRLSAMSMSRRGVF